MEPFYHPLGVACAWIIATVLFCVVCIAAIFLTNSVWGWLYRAITIAIPGMCRARFRRRFGSFDSMAFMYQERMDEQTWSFVHEEFYRGMYQGAWLVFWLAVVPSILVSSYFTFIWQR